MDEKNIFNVIFHKFCYKPKPDGCAFQELGTGQLEILKNEKREKILKFTKRNYEMTFSFVYYLFFNKNVTKFQKERVN